MVGGSSVLAYVLGTQIISLASSLKGSHMENYETVFLVSVMTPPANAVMRQLLLRHKVYNHMHVFSEKANVAGFPLMLNST